MTYVSFTGIFSEADIDMLRETSERIQIICLYDVRTGGPKIFTKDGEYDMRSFRKDNEYEALAKKSKGLLLIPIDTTLSGKSFNPIDVQSILDNIIYPAIISYSPECIVYNFDPSFSDPNNPSPFYINNEA
mmetsp:Transcript_16435/g.14119  ORF Transcript_16435/g.14119 Transcript_16435/m.14119 type:complete len:131 (+) Transcript_16435:692-1084(+)